MHNFKFLIFNLPFFNCQLSIIHNHSILNSYNPVAHIGKMFIVGNDYKSMLECVAEVKKQAVKFVAVLAVEVSRWFVGKYHRRRIYQRPCYCHTLLLASRKFCRLMGETVAKIKETKKFCSAFFGIRLVHAANHCRNTYIFHSGKLWQQVVKLEYKTDILVAKISQLLGVEGVYIGIIDNYPTFVGLKKCACNLQKGGFARSACANNRDNLTASYFEVDTAQYR